MAKLNERYRVKPVFSKGESEAAKVMVGKVVYVHPEGRYAVLEFEGTKGNPRESFWPEDLTDSNRMLEKRRA